MWALLCIVKTSTFHDSARRFAHLALDEGVDGLSADLAVLHMATAVEHLAKAVLCEVHPALVLDPKHSKFFDALLHTVRQPSVPVPSSGLRTISCTEALARVRRLLPSVPSEEEAKRLIQARDGLVHAGSHGDPDAADLMVLGVRLCESMLGLLRGAQGFWAGHTDGVAAMLSEHSSEVQRTVTLRLETARATLRTDQGDLREPDRIREFNIISEAHAPQDDDDEAAEYDCPACSFPAFLSGTAEMREGEMEWDYNDGVSEPVGPQVSVWLLCDSLRCFVCGLRLTTPEQLVVAGVPTEIEKRSATSDDLAEYYSDYYNDGY